MNKTGVMARSALPLQCIVLLWGLNFIFFPQSCVLLIGLRLPYVDVWVRWMELTDNGLLTSRATVPSIAVLCFCSFIHIFRVGSGFAFSRWCSCSKIYFMGSSFKLWQQHSLASASVCLPALHPRHVSQIRQSNFAGQSNEIGLETISLAFAESFDRCVAIRVSKAVQFEACKWVCVSSSALPCRDIRK